MNVYEKTYQKYGLSLTQLKIIELVGKDKKVLEVGPSSGYMTKVFKENGCLVDVVEIDESVLEKVSLYCQNILKGSIEDSKVLSKIKGNYDFIILADVLEHLINPEKTLKEIFDLAEFNTRLIVSTPNIACWPVRKQLFFKGDFQYQESGILDKTHVHFFTVNTLIKEVKRSGWKVKDVFGTMTRLPFEGLINKLPIFNLVFRFLIRPNFVRRYKNLSFVHILLTAEK